MEKLNIQPFVVGDKVVCITNNTDEVEGANYGTAVNKNYIVCDCMWYGVNKWDWWIKVNGIEYWVKAKRFRKIQEAKFKAVSFEKVMEETEQLCEN